MIVFDQSTNRGGASTTTIDQAAVDALFTLSASDSFGDMYSGKWSTGLHADDTLTILLSESADTSMIELTLGSTTVTLVSSGNVQDILASSGASTATSPKLQGTFTSPPAIVMAVAVNSVNQPLGPIAGDMVVITFDQPTSGSGTLNKSDVDGLLVLGGGSLGSSNFGTNYSASWTSNMVLTVLLGPDTTGIHLVPGVTTVGVRSSAGLTDVLSSTSSTSSSMTLIGTFTTTPGILSVTAANSGHGLGINNGDTVTIVFDQSTNQATSATSGVSQSFIDSLLMLSSGASFGAAYNGSWTTTYHSSDTLQITITDSTGSVLVPLSTTVTILASAYLRNSVASGSASTAVHTLSGSFTSPPAIVSFVASNSNNQPGTGVEDSVAITFDQATDFVTLYPTGMMSSTDIAGLLQLGSLSDGFGSSCVGVWSTSGARDILNITIKSTTGLHLVPLVTTVQMIGDLQDVYGTSGASTSGPIMLNGTFTSPPVIVSVTATNDGGNIGVGSRDKIVVVFDQSTNGGLAVNRLDVVRAEIDAMFSLSASSSFGTDYSGVWNSALTTLTITLGDDTTGVSLTPTMTNFTLMATGLVQDVTGSSGISSGNGVVTLGGTFTSAPSILSFTAKHTGSHVGSTDKRGDSLVIVFDQSTNRGGASTTTIDQAAVDALFTLSASDSFGDMYSGKWSTGLHADDTLTILLSESADTSMIELTLGSTTVTLVSSGNVQDILASSGASTATSPKLQGTFTSPPAIVMAVAVNSVNQPLGPIAGDMVVITFDQPTSGSGTLNKSDVDGLLVLGGGSLGSSNFGTNYSASWTSNMVLTVLLGPDTTGIHLVPGVTTVGVRSSAGLTDVLSSTSSTSSSMTLIGTFTTTPGILSGAQLPTVATALALITATRLRLCLIKARIKQHLLPLECRSLSLTRF